QRTREREAQEHESTQSVITQQLQQACEQEAHESEPSLEIIAQHNRSEHEKNNTNPTENATSIPSKRSIAQRARRDREQIKRARIQIGTTISGQSQNNNIRQYSFY
ncbi:6625_t:CDS:1, partial [Gigaspora rosea]